MPDDTREDRASRTYARLRELIVQGRLAPGARIIETDVAERLGVSRTPVRAALQRLEQEGFIIAGGAGHRWRPTVAPLTKEDADELLHLIGQLEGLAAWYAAQLPDDDRTELTERLQAINRELEESTSREPREPANYFDLDGAFHRAVMEAGAGPRLRGLLEAIRPQAERYVRVYVTALTSEIETSIREHQAVIQAMEDRDAVGAQHAMEANWRGAAERFSGVIEQMGERGSW